MAKSLKNAPPLAANLVFIVAARPELSKALTHALRGAPDLVVGGAVATAARARKEIARLNPALVLIELRRHDAGEMKFIRELRKAHPQSKLLLVAGQASAHAANQALRAGGDGYLLNRESPEEISQAIRDVLGGRIYISEAVLARGGKATPKQTPKPPARSLEQLTDAELELLGLLGAGRSNPEIARELRTNAKVVAAQLRGIQRKLKLKTENALIHYAVCWVELGKT